MRRPCVGTSHGRLVQFHPTIIEAPDGGSTSGADAGSFATDINDRGVVVGAAQDSAGTAHPMIWTEDGGMRVLFDCGSQGGNARGNGRGRQWR